MSYLGDIALEKTFDTKFCTVTTTGAPTVLAGTPVISAYLDNSTTQLTAGITLTVDFDGVVGLNNVRVVATAANGYASGVNYQLVITTGTVGGTSVVGYVVAEFSIQARSFLRPATADRTLIVDANGLADANMVKLGPTGAGTAQTARDVGASVLLSTGTGAGQLDFTSGVVKANLAQILGTALTETVGLLAGGFKKFFNVAAPTGTLNSIPDAVAGANAGLFIAGTNAATTITTALTTTFTGNLTGSVGSVTAGVTLAASAVQAIWDALTSALTTVGSIGKLLVDNINATISSRASQASLDIVDDFVDTEMAAALAAVDTEVAAIKTQTDKLTFTIANQLDSNVLSMAANVITATAIAADALGALELAAGAATEIAETLLKIDMSTVTGEAARSPLNALRYIRNKVSIAAGTMTVTKEDDVTAAWTAAVVGTAGADPITSVDPA